MTKDIEREAFEKALAGNGIYNLKVCTIFDDEKNEYFASDVCDPSEDHIVESINLSWRMWQAAKAHEAEKLKGCVVVPKDQTEDWYLDDNANMWITEPDEWLCDLYVGEVQSVEHKEYLITKSDTLYAAIVWDDENQDSGTWEFFKTEEEAEKAAAHCKAMLEAARGGNEEK
ncbi:hypothetical protein ACPC5Q_02595 [Acinetobacter junii]|uniref:hypothetical protein n=1 Tax=Acinetobacter junii TaxID=40215 RepID=UPI003C1FA7A7